MSNTKKGVIINSIEGIFITRFKCDGFEIKKKHIQFKDNNKIIFIIPINKHIIEIENEK